MTVAIGIIGLAQSGKTTVFNALTKGHAGTGGYSREAAHTGIARVPEPRLEMLAKVLHPKKVVPAEVRYLDVGASVKGLAQEAAITGELLSQLTNTDALINVARAFTDESIAHIEGSVDAQRDIATMELELTFSDLAIIERRLKKIELSLKGAPQAERQSLHREQELLMKIKAELEKDVPIRELSLSDDEARSIASYQFLSAKPLLIVVNIGEDQLSQAQVLEAELSSSYAGPRRRLITLCGKLEMELAELDNSSAAELRSGFDLEESGLNRTIKLSYELLGLISFFTIASGEFRAWSITRGTTALKAAGKIHSDMERGFIRAEVISCDDLLKSGSLAEARKHGLLRLEGKNYIVQDGDVITFLFNV